MDFGDGCNYYDLGQDGVNLRSKIHPKDTSALCELHRAVCSSSTRIRIATWRAPFDFQFVCVFRFLQVVQRLLVNCISM